MWLVVQISVYMIPNSSKVPQLILRNIYTSDIIYNLIACKFYIEGWLILIKSNQIRMYAYQINQAWLIFKLYLLELIM